MLLQKQTVTSDSQPQTLARDFSSRRLSAPAHDRTNLVVPTLGLVAAAWQRDGILDSVSKSFELPQPLFTPRQSKKSTIDEIPESGFH